MIVSQSTETRSTMTEVEVSQRDLAAIVTAAMKERGFVETLKSLKTGRGLRYGMRTVSEGVVEMLGSGRCCAALQTDEGRLLIHGTEGTGQESTDPQLMPSTIGQSIQAPVDSDELTAEQLLRQLADAGDDAPCGLLCTIELTRFDPAQRQVLLPLLWRYIINHRNSNDVDELIATGAAIRKYVAIMPMDRMGELGVLLEPGHRASLAIDLEIEVAKMIYRNFEVHPPTPPDPHPELAERLWELVQAYVNPRVLPRDKYPAATSLAIAAIVAMRSPLAEQAWQAAQACPYRWFAELVDDDLRELHEQWAGKSPDAAAWLNERTGVGCANLP